MTFPSTSVYPSSSDDPVNEAIAELASEFAELPHCIGCMFKDPCRNILLNLPIKFRQPPKGCALSFLTGYDLNPNGNVE